MSELQTAEVTETATEGTEQNAATVELPANHPLVTALAAQKATIKDLKTKAAVPAKVADALKTHLVALHEIDTEDAELFLTADEPDLLLKQVTRLLGQSTTRQRRNHVPREGENPTPTDRSEAAYARELFGG